MITKDEHIILQEGYQELVIEADEPLSVVIEAPKKSEVYLKVLKAKEIALETKTKEDAEVTFLCWNEANEPVTFREHHEVYQNGLLQIAYGEINQANSTHELVVDLLEEGAKANVSSATLTQVDKRFTMSVVSKVPHTEGTMENYGVVLTDGNYFVDATGAIKKGAYGSSSHQTSRALCFDEGMKANIIPRLLIDENDVMASHATSLGSVDEDQLYYMQARGLSPQQCTALISTGYLMPITRTIKDEALQETLVQELERKIGELCLM